MNVNTFLLNVFCSIGHKTTLLRWVSLWTIRLLWQPETIKRGPAKRQILPAKSIWKTIHGAHDKQLLRAIRPAALVRGRGRSPNLLIHRRG